MQYHHTICKCYSSEHTLRFTFDGEDNEFITEVYLNQPNNIFKRILIAIKYVLGYTSKYGHWDCTIMSKSEAIKLSSFINDRYGLYRDY